MTEPQSEANGERNRWEGRPIASALLRTAVLGVPIGASVAAGILIGRHLPTATGWAGVAGQLAVVLAGATIVLLAVERVARRLLPLAALLRLTLAFPDRAPSRIRVAVRSRNLRSLRSWAEEAAGGGGDQEDARRATDVLTLATALSTHDRRTRGHSEKVRSLTMLVATEMGIEGEQAERLQWAALLHDIGKLTVPSEILNKKSAPDNREWRILQRHPGNGAEIAGPLRDWLGDEITAIGQHHERWDGNGYPQGLCGDDIGLAARIVAVVDSFETMTAVRSYKKPMKPATAREELARCSGSHFDPGVVRPFLSLSIGKLTWTVGVASWMAQMPFVGLLPRAGAQVTSVAAAAPAASVSVAGVAAVALGLTVSAPAPAEAGPGPAAGIGDPPPVAQLWAAHAPSWGGGWGVRDDVGPPPDTPVASPPPDVPGTPSATTASPGSRPSDRGNANPPADPGNANPPTNPGPPADPGKANPPANPGPRVGLPGPPINLPGPPANPAPPANPGPPANAGNANGGPFSG